MCLLLKSWEQDLKEALKLNSPIAFLGARQSHVLILSDVHLLNSLKQVNYGLPLILGKVSIDWIFRDAKRQQLLSLSDAMLLILA